MAWALATWAQRCRGAHSGGTLAAKSAASPPPPASPKDAAGAAAAHRSPSPASCWPSAFNIWAQCRGRCVQAGLLRDAARTAG